MDKQMKIWLYPLVAIVVLYSLFAEALTSVVGGIVGALGAGNDFKGVVLGVVLVAVIATTMALAAGGPNKRGWKAVLNNLIVLIILLALAWGVNTYMAIVPV